MERSAMKSMSVPQFEMALAAMPSAATPRMLAVLDYIREQGETIFHALGGEQGVTLWAQRQYDLLIAPIDIPWLDEKSEIEVVDQPMKALIAYTVRFVHTTLLHKS